MLTMTIIAGKLTPATIFAADVQALRNAALCSGQCRLTALDFLRRAEAAVKELRETLEAEVATLD